VACIILDYFLVGQSVWVVDALQAIPTNPSFRQVSLVLVGSSALLQLVSLLCPLTTEPLLLDLRCLPLLAAAASLHIVMDEMA
jgi:hypothetical protein